MQERQFSAGETIFSEGDDSGEAYLIHSGRVEILKNSPRGQLCLAVVGAGDVIGEMGLLEELPRSATARAVDPVLTSAIGADEFLRLLLDDPEEALGLLRALFERLRTMNQVLADLDILEEGASEVPRVVLYPLTAEAELVVPLDGLEVTQFPFRIGRSPETREETALAFNDIQLADEKPHRVSLNHLSFDLGASGVVVRDRGSRQGTLVNGERLGPREERDQAPLRSGENEVVVGAMPSALGAPHSPYRFRIVVGPE